MAPSQPPTSEPGLSPSDEDILEAMEQIPGYLDITTSDFRVLYELTYRHALERLFGGVRAEGLMRTDLKPLPQDLPLDAAVVRMADQDAKGLAVVSGARVVGILTETDLLHRLGASTFAQLLVGILEGSQGIGSCCRQATVAEAMTRPAVTVEREAGFKTILGAFHRHGGRSMPVVDGAGNYQGLLLRKDFIGTCHLESIL